jgi:hypothetical protein
MDFEIELGRFAPRVENPRALPHGAGPSQHLVLGIGAFQSDLTSFHRKFEPFCEF